MLENENIFINFFKRRKIFKIDNFHTFNFLRFIFYNFYNYMRLPHRTSSEDSAILTSIFEAKNANFINDL